MRLNEFKNQDSGPKKDEGNFKAAGGEPYFRKYNYEKKYFNKNRKVLHGQHLNEIHNVVGTPGTTGDKFDTHYVYPRLNKPLRKLPNE